MSLSAVLTTLIEYVEDVIVNDCGQPPLVRRLRYFGSGGLPQDGKCIDGVLSVAFDRGWAAKTFPRDASGEADPCPGLPTYDLALRYDRCWIEPEIDEVGITLLDSTWDTDSANLSDVADCVARALIAVQCGNASGELAQALLATVRKNTFRYREVVPTRGTSTARLTWRIYAGPAQSA